jgi:hypothetical protein
MVLAIFVPWFRAVARQAEDIEIKQLAARLSQFCIPVAPPASDTER